MNKLIEKSYKLSVILTLLVVGFYLFMFTVGGLFFFSDAPPPKSAEILIATFTLFLLGLTIFSYVLALIHSIKQSKVIATVIYGFILLAIAMVVITFTLFPHG